jgi:hypothetical protein
LAKKYTNETKEKPLEAVFCVRSVPRVYNKSQLPLLESLETAVKRLGGWFEMAAGRGFCGVK